MYKVKNKDEGKPKILATPRLKKDVERVRILIRRQ